MKVTITIDDADKGIVTLFGPNSINGIADAMGYMPMEPIPEDELPEKVERQLTEEEISSGLYGEGVTTTMDYPEGTEFYQPNTKSKAEHVGETILNNRIIPALLEHFVQIKKAQAQAQIDEGLKQAEDVLRKAAVIEVVE